MTILIAPDLTPDSPPTYNPDLKAVHNALIALIASLDGALGRATTVAQVIALTDEIAEVNARVNAVGARLLLRQTAAIRRHSEAVAAAIPEVEATIARFDDLRAFVGGIARFLTIVDKLVDVTKLI